ncbi:Kiz [Phodopus roborovskii]|uniref:Centrosomal protein kizuna n=1 Tax=Phodopus roborovskii TaxID=109678 RepID=A0AAU9Z4X6_PHORO|nr:Kiz [Phodopus roborovskii]
MPRGRGGGGVHQDPAASALLANPSYYERVGQLQQALRDSEKKRLDLEDKLYEYNKSDKCRAKLKCAKLKKYLREVCESERRARVRNQEYVKKFEHVQTYVEHLTTNTEKLQKLKDAVRAGINSRTAMSRGLYQPATIFMGRQMSAISSIDDYSTEQKSKQPTKNCSIPDPHSHQQTAQSSCVTDSYVIQTNSDTQCLNKSDKIDGKTSLQIGEKTPVTSHVLSEEEQTHCLEISSTRHSKSNLSEGRKSAELHSSLQERLSPENRTTDLKCDSSSGSEGSGGEILTQEHIEVRRERVSLPVPTLSVSEHHASANKWAGEKPSAWEGFSDDLAHGDPESPKAFLKMQEEQEEESSCSSSDLTVSVSEEKLIFENLEALPNPGTKPESEDGRQASQSLYIKLQRDPLFTDYEVSSGCGDESKEESMAAIPVTEGHREADIIPSELFQFSLGAAVKETKAYQLLKKSTLQDNSNQTEERFESQFSSLDIGSSTFKTKTAHKIASEASFSSSEGSPLSRHESKRDPVTTIKSNAFWGESDDSNSEIEAALRPRDHNMSDDFDDFYDT